MATQEQVDKARKTNFSPSARSCLWYSWVHYRNLGSDQKQEMFLDILCLFSVNY